MRINTDEQGFSIIELLLALTILSVVSLTFFGFFGQAFLAGKKAEDKLVAVNLARQYAKNIDRLGLDWETKSDSKNPTVNPGLTSFTYTHYADYNSSFDTDNNPDRKIRVNNEIYNIWFFSKSGSGGLEEVVIQVYIDETSGPIAETYAYK
ncbi:prepilin-type N-terminal cleavage/methylation domain-containing protein [Anaerobacillus sp. MEB173]|uniref:type IV pilus modification PilV family protein n=1 Tax=Anaerobacillus sp. MEB173 TaxID=3383345 RepID=UPI003F93CA73